MKTLQFKPVGNYDTEDVESEFDGDELTSASMRNTFSRPNWNNCIQYAGTEAIDQTCYRWKS